MKHRLIWLILLVLIIVGISGGFIFLNYKNMIPRDEKDDSSQYQYITKQFSDVVVIDELSAKEALNDAKTAIGLIDLEEELILKSEHKVDNVLYHRFQQAYKGLPIYQKEIIMESIDGIPTNLVYNTINIDSNFSIEFQHSLDDVKVALEEYLKMSIEITQSQKMIYDHSGLILAYLVDIKTSNCVAQYIVLDTLEIIEVQPIINSSYKGLDGLESNLELNNGLYIPAKKIGIYNTEYTDKNIPILKYSLDGIANIKNASQPNKKETTLLDYVSKTFDYYANILHHRSFDGQGNSEIRLFTDVDHVGVNSTIGNAKNNALYYSTSNYEIEFIAMGLCGNECLNTYQLEVLAHEYTHGVFNHIVSATNDVEASALTEAYADIFGLLVKNYYQDVDFTWNISLYRDLSQLSNAYRTNYHQQYSNDPHENSTIFSSVFYKIYTGVDADNKKSRITNTTTLANMYYHSLYLLPAAGGFKEAEYAVILTAQKLYNEKKISANQFAYLKKSFENVGLNVSNLELSQKDDEKTFYYVKDNFTISGHDVKGNVLDNYHLKIDVYNNHTMELIETLVDEDISGVYQTHFEQTATKKNEIQKYYQITITKDAKTSTILAVQINDKYTPRTALRLFLNIMPEMTVEEPDRDNSVISQEQNQSVSESQPTLPETEKPTDDQAPTNQIVTVIFDKSGLDGTLAYESASCTVDATGFCYVTFPTLDGKAMTWCPAEGDEDGCIISTLSRPAKIGVAKNETWHIALD